MASDSLLALFFSVTVASVACAIELIKCRKQLERSSALLEELVKKSR